MTIGQEKIIGYTYRIYVTYLDDIFRQGKFWSCFSFGESFGRIFMAVLSRNRAYICTFQNAHISWSSMVSFPFMKIVHFVPL